MLEIFGERLHPEFELLGDYVSCDEVDVSYVVCR
jgi:hypothetical protein